MEKTHLPDVDYTSSLEDRIAELEAELAATRLTWRTGVVMEKGYYWREGFDGPQLIRAGNTPIDAMARRTKWSGPILPPIDEEGNEKG
jgi:hypothetical protein